MRWYPCSLAERGITVDHVIVPCWGETVTYGSHAAIHSRQGGPDMLVAIIGCEIAFWGFMLCTLAAATAE